MVFIRSAVRIPTPDPLAHDSPSFSKRQPSPHPQSPSPRRQRRQSPAGKDDALPSFTSAPASTRPAAGASEPAIAGTANPNGGVYIPPARLRAMQAQVTDKTSEEYQRIAWEALKKSINGLINKVNVSNIKFIVPELFGENLVRGRGLFCRSVMKAQAASLPFTPIYAAMIAVVNTKLPQVGELLAHRLVLQFRKSFRRNDKAVCLSSTMFLAHLINQQVVHEMLAAQMLLLLLHKPTDDSVEIAVALTREVGQHLEEMDGKVAMAVFDQFRSILHEADIDKRVQYMIEVLFQIRRDKFKDHPPVKEELDLVEEEDQIIHQISLDDKSLAASEGLNVFKLDVQYEENEATYERLKREILGDDSDEEDDDDGSGADAVRSDGQPDESDDEPEENKRQQQIEIKDQTNAELVNLRRKIYLTIKSSGGVEECCHKLLRIDLPDNRLGELTSMVVECASQERTYNKFYGLIGQQLCRTYRMWRDLFEDDFNRFFDTIHRYETARIRIIAQFFAYLLASDAIRWHVFSAVRLSVDDTTSSSRIFIKILFEDLVAELGMRRLAVHLADDDLRSSYAGILSEDDPRITKFAAIGLGALAGGLKKQLMEILPPPDQEFAVGSRSPSPY